MPGCGKPALPWGSVFGSAPFSESVQSHPIRVCPHAEAGHGAVFMFCGLALGFLGPCTHLSSPEAEQLLPLSSGLGRYLSPGLPSCLPPPISSQHRREYSVLGKRLVQRGKRLPSCRDPEGLETGWPQERCIHKRAPGPQAAPSMVGHPRTL